MAHLQALHQSLRRGLIQFSRQTPTQVVAILTAAVALTVAGLAWAVNVQINRLIDMAAGQARLVAFLKVEATPDLDRLSREIGGWPGVSGAKAVTSVQALEQLSRLLGNNPDLLEGLEPDLIPPLIEVRPTAALLGTDKINQLKTRLEGLQQVQEVSMSATRVAALRTWTGWIGRLGFWLAGALSLAALFIVYASIRLNFLSRSEEIEIMGLIGASAWFIRGPYLVHGVAQGLTAALIAVILLFGCQAILDLALTSGPFQPVVTSWAVVLRLLWAGVMVGLIGAWLGLGRIKVLERW